MLETLASLPAHARDHRPKLVAIALENLCLAIAIGKAIAIGEIAPSSIIGDYPIRLNNSLECIGNLLGDDKMLRAMNQYIVAKAHGKRIAVDTTTKAGVKYERYGHLSDCLDYLLCYYMRDSWYKYKSGGDGNGYVVSTSVISEGFNY